MAGDIIVSGGAAVDDQGRRQSLAIDSITLGTGAAAMSLTTQVGTFKSLVLGGQLLSGHDARYAWANDMQSNGTLVPESAQDVGLPRWSLADAATQRVKWVWEIPAEWNEVAIRFGWNQEAAGTGNVVWQYAYTLVYPFASPNVDAGAVTTISVGAIPVSGTQFAFKYEIPAVLDSIATADGAFGSKPFIQSSLSRLGADAGDTFVGAVAVSLATMTRTG